MIHNRQPIAMITGIATRTRIGRRTLWPMVSAGLAISVWIVQPAAAQCRLTAVHESAPDVTRRSMGIRVGPIEWGEPLVPRFANRAFGWPMRPRELAVELPDERLAAIKATFTEALYKSLQHPNRVLTRGDDQSAEVVLHAELVDVDPGNRLVRAYAAAEWASAAVHAILATGDGRPLVTLRCNRATGGGPLGWGGPLSLWQSSDSLLRKDVEKIAQSISRELGKSEQAARRLAARRSAKIDVGELRYSSRLHLERPTEQWSLKDAASVMGTFMTHTMGNIVGGPPVLGKGVHSLWLTDPAYRAIHRTQALMSENEKSMWVHPFSIVLEGDLLHAMTARSAYAFAVWPFEKPPYYWNVDAIAAATFLRRARHGDERIAPIGVLGPPWPPAVFLFPRTTEDGQPLVESLDTTIELHTELNGRRILSRFDLSKFPLTGITELSPVTSTGATGAK
jgi:hypothetical protein